MDALCAVLDCIEDQEADLDIGGLAAACMLALDLEVVREVDEAAGLDILSVRLPGGLCELVFAPEGTDLAELGNPDRDAAHGAHDRVGQFVTAPQGGCGPVRQICA